MSDSGETFEFKIRSALYVETYTTDHLNCGPSGLCSATTTTYDEKFEIRLFCEELEWPGFNAGEYTSFGAIDMVFNFNQSGLRMYYPQADDWNYVLYFWANWTSNDKFIYHPEFELLGRKFEHIYEHNSGYGAIYMSERQRLIGMKLATPGGPMQDYILIE